MFKDWENYYLLLGGAAGSLIGLLFIVATLFAGRDRDRTLKGAQVYMTPTVSNLTVVLALSAMAMAPGVSRPFAAVCVTVAAGGGLVYGLWIYVHFRKLHLDEPPPSPHRARWARSSRGWTAPWRRGRSPFR